LFYSTGSWTGHANKQTNYKRKVINDGYLRFEDYFKDTISSKITFFSKIDFSIAEGYATCIKRRMRDQYYKTEYNNLIADYTDFSKGEIKFKCRCNGNEMRYYEVYNAEGFQILDETGSGSLITENKSETEYLIYKDSVLVNNFGIRKKEGDTIYYHYDKMASPKIGYKQFYQKMGSMIIYPLTARQKGIEDTFYIQFIVDKNGALTEFKCLNGSVRLFEKRTIKKLKKLENWDPAELNGNNVKSKYTLPFVFKLTD
jgi:hypothetical protein